VVCKLGILAHHLVLCNIASDVDQAHTNITFSANLGVPLDPRSLLSSSFFPFQETLEVDKPWHDILLFLLLVFFIKVEFH
jgi:hypothetical protein